LEGSYALHNKRPEGTKYEKKTYFGYSGRHQVHMNFQTSPPPSPYIATPATVSTTPIEKIMSNFEFIFVLLFVLFYYYKTSYKLIVKK
jgi:hypothetical protein